MKRAGWTVLVVALCAASAVLMWRDGFERAQPTEAGEPTRAAPAGVASGDATDEAQRTSAPRSSQDLPPPLPREGYAARFRDAPDLHEFARSLLGAARAGDHAAQFYIFRAKEYCADEYRLYLRGRGVNLSLDDALKMAATKGWPFDPEVVRRAHARCHAIVEAAAASFDDRADWLRMASDGGYPLAQVIAVQKQSLELARTNRDGDAGRGQRHDLVAKAIRSRDPEVIWEIGNTPFSDTDPEDDDDHEQIAWYLAACQRGFDCSAQSEVMRLACLYDRACQPYESVADLYRRSRGDEFPEIEARARWINEKLDAGDWEALGF